MTTNLEDEMAGLLPFYVSGRLDGHDLSRVKQWIETDPKGQAALRNAIAEHAEVVADNEAVVPPGGALDKLMRDVEREPQRQNLSQLVKPGFFKEFADWLGGTPGVAGWAAAAAMTLIVAVQTGALLQRPAEQPYTVSSGSKSERTGPVYMVRFSTDAAIADISAELGAVGASIVEGPLGKDSYLVRFEESDLLGPVAERVKQLKGRAGLVQLMFEKKNNEGP
jgi:anti-sigma factor RsiW